MELIQFNWFVSQGLLRFDPHTAQLAIDYARYDSAIDSLLTEVLRLQAAGDKTAVAAFFSRWTTRNGDLHGRLAARLQEARGPRFVVMKYAALGD